MADTSTIVTKKGYEIAEQFVEQAKSDIWDALEALATEGFVTMPHPSDIHEHGRFTRIVKKMAYLVKRGDLLTLEAVKELYCNSISTFTTRAQEMLLQGDFAINGNAHYCTNSERFRFQQVLSSEGSFILKTPRHAAPLATIHAGKKDVLVLDAISSQLPLPAGAIPQGLIALPPRGVCGEYPAMAPRLLPVGLVVYRPFAHQHSTDKPDVLVHGSLSSAYCWSMDAFHGLVGTAVLAKNAERLTNCLHLVHSTGMALVDIKPANLFCDQQGNFDFADFGGAVRIGDSLEEWTPGFLFDGVPRGTATVKNDWAALALTFICLARKHTMGVDTNFFKVFNVFKHGVGLRGANPLDAAVLNMIELAGL